MPPLATVFAITAILFSATAFQQEDERILLGGDLRAVDREDYKTALKIIQYRVKERLAVEPLLIFCAYSDPDILGLIATDEGLPLAVREVAANAVLDQLYIADSYFQVCSERYLAILAESSERSLRIKGSIGLATMEHWCYLTFAGGLENLPSMLRLRLAAEAESDPEARELLASLAGGDPSVLAGAAAWSGGREREEPYRRFDSIPPMPPEAEGESGEELSTFWRVHRAALELFEKLEGSEDTPQPPGVVVSEVLTALENADPGVLRGFLARFRATMPAQSPSRLFPPAFLEFFRRIALSRPDPYIRSLALAPISLGPRGEAVPFLLSRMSMDNAPLVRLSAADLLKTHSSDQQIRLRMMASFRGEEDPRVKLRALHSLLWPHGDHPPPDIQAFLLGRLRDQQDKALLEYIVVVLGNARVQSAAGPLASMARRTSHQVLRERIEEALRKIRGRASNLPRP